MMEDPSPSETVERSIFPCKFVQFVSFRQYGYGLPRSALTQRRPSQRPIGESMAMQP
jgi:hypothetical protein